MNRIDAAAPPAGGSTILAGAAIGEGDIKAKVRGLLTAVSPRWRQGNDLGRLPDVLPFEQLRAVLAKLAHVPSECEIPAIVAPRRLMAEVLAFEDSRRSRSMARTMMEL
eukprot:CAMPEP_0115309340 /NCGR_PEP_ID=MMETSP0270-20121206/74201_1 /TAXON_ID=71861 /ORGANISM="Scrippsiella trochoidea, Strain CCMP3099" /LENGTH=108 /DNA_ID=CAMNT_0002728001 /DNA_START=217 /DNA_END=545 /DNA_ORIENTATION=-